MKKLFIIGAGGLAREVYSFISSHNFTMDDWLFEGFLDDDNDLLTKFGLSHLWRGSVGSNVPSSDNLYLIAIGSCSVKAAIFSEMQSKGAHFTNYIHPTAFVGKTVNLGKSCIILPHSVIPTDSIVGDAVVINSFCTIGHDTVVGSFTTISGHCDITGGVHIGQSVFLSSGVKIAPSKKIGDNASVGIGSIVVKNVKPGVTVFGNPAKVLF